MRVTKEFARRPQTVRGGDTSSPRRWPHGILTISAMSPACSAANWQPTQYATSAPRTNSCWNSRSPRTAWRSSTSSRRLPVRAEKSCRFGLGQRPRPRRRARRSLGCAPTQPGQGGLVRPVSRACRHRKGTLNRPGSTGGSDLARRSRPDRTWPAVRDGPRPTRSSAPGGKPAEQIRVPSVTETRSPESQRRIRPGLRGLRGRGTRRCRVVGARSPLR